MTFCRRVGWNKLEIFYFNARITVWGNICLLTRYKTEWKILSLDLLDIFSNFIKRKDTPVGASAQQYIPLSLSPSHQQLSSSHATDRESEVAEVEVRNDAARVEEQDVSAVRTVRSR